MSDLVAVRKALDEVQQLAEKAKAASPYKGQWIDLDDLRTVMRIPDAEIEHIWRWSPSLLLRWVEAWRTQIDGYEQTLERHWHLTPESTGLADSDGCAGCERLTWPCADYRAAEAGLASIALALGVKEHQ